MPRIALPVPGSLLLLLFQSAAALSDAQPVDGFWYNPERPGNGATLARQGDQLVVGVFTYGEDGAGVWGLASGDFPVNGEFVATLQQFAGGDPIGGPDQQSAVAIAEQTLRMQFEGDVFATIRIGDGEAETLTPLQFGFEPTGDFFGQMILDAPVILPNVDANWLLAPVEPGAVAPRRMFREQGPVLSPPHPLFGGEIPSYKYTGEDLSLASTTPECRSRDSAFDIPIDYCGFNVQPELQNESLTVAHIAPVTQMDWARWRLTPMDLPDHVLSNEILADVDQHGPDLVAFRLGNAAFRGGESSASYTRTANRFRAAQGLWWTGVPDSGLFIEQQGQRLALIIYTYGDDGTRRWSLASGNIDSQGRFTADLIDYADGLPFGVRVDESAEPTATTSRSIRVDFSGSSAAQVTITKDGAADTFAARAFNVAVPESIHDATVPDPTGEWVFAALSPQEDFELSLSFAPARRQDDSTRFDAMTPTGDLWVLTCPDAQMSCVLRDPADTDRLLIPHNDLGLSRIQAETPAGQPAWGFRIY